MIFLTSYKVRKINIKKTVWKIFPASDQNQNCSEKISEIKNLLKVNGIDFECDPLGKYCLNHINHNSHINL